MRISFSILFSKEIVFFIFARKLKEFKIHLFAKYCLVIKIVLERSKAALIYFHTGVSISLYTCEVAGQLKNKVESKASSLKVCSNLLSRLFVSK